MTGELVGISAIGAPVVPLDGTFAVRAQLAQSFSRRRLCDIAAVASFGDGTEQTLLVSELSFNSTTSNLQVSLVFQQARNGRSGRDAGMRRVCDRCLAAVQPGRSSGTGAVHLKMPTWCQSMSRCKPRLAAPGDSATVSPISISSSAMIYVSAMDGSTRDLERQPHADRLAASSAACAQVSQGNLLTLFSGGSCDRVHVYVVAVAHGGLELDAACRWCISPPAVAAVVSSYTG